MTKHHSVATFLTFYFLNSLLLLCLPIITYLKQSVHGLGDARVARCFRSTPNHYFSIVCFLFMCLCTDLFFFFFDFFGTYWSLVSSLCSQLPVVSEIYRAMMRSSCHVSQLSRTHIVSLPPTHSRCCSSQTVSAVSIDMGHSLLHGR